VDEATCRLFGQQPSSVILAATGCEIGWFSLFVSRNVRAVPHADRTKQHGVTLMMAAARPVVLLAAGIAAAVHYLEDRQVCAGGCSGGNCMCDAVVHKVTASLQQV
jgi:hypothetical protein